MGPVIRQRTQLHNGTKISYLLKFCHFARRESESDMVTDQRFSFLRCLIWWWMHKVAFVIILIKDIFSRPFNHFFWKSDNFVVSSDKAGIPILAGHKTITTGGVFSQILACFWPDIIWFYLFKPPKNRQREENCILIEQLTIHRHAVNRHCLVLKMLGAKKGH